MEQTLILAPMTALAALTFVVLGLIPIRRFQAVGKQEISGADFKFGESGNVPGYVSIPNRNYMNLLELPVLFYVIGLALFVTGRLSELQLGLAWSYVGLRAVHSLIHLTNNHVIARLTAFALSNFVLMAMWAVFAFGGGLQPIGH